MGKNKTFMFSMGIIAGVIGGVIAGVLYAPKPGEESRRELKDAACKLYDENSPEISEAKKQALESVDLVRYKLERQLRRFANMLKNRKMRKAKELEDADSEFTY